MPAAKILPSERVVELHQLTSLWREKKEMQPEAVRHALAEIKAVRGYLCEALDIYRQALQLAASGGEPRPIGTADLYRGISEIYLEQGNLEAATHHLTAGKKLGQQAVLSGRSTTVSADMRDPGQLFVFREHFRYSQQTAG